MTRVVGLLIGDENDAQCNALDVVLMVSFLGMVVGYHVMIIFWHQFLTSISKKKILKKFATKIDDKGRAIAESKKYLVNKTPSKFTLFLYNSYADVLLHIQTKRDNLCLVK